EASAANARRASGSVAGTGRMFAPLSSRDNTLATVEQTIPPSPHFTDSRIRPRLENAEAEAFYAEAIRKLAEMRVPFLLAGTYAVSAYTGISRVTKDLDVFCKAGDYTRILAGFQELGYEIEIEDDRWLGKVYKGPNFFDV